ncbi:MAG: biopolymer transporter ExbD [Myxococcaceae bacterium]|nr:biopolymer transporter ExbD [Myxococcaceae bacterium]MCA3014695.1 biopolymer transporter ExbD [Myxococcaceae bacterium]
MSVGEGGGKRRGAVRPAMNVTPLVDVVLVLLIIFMVVTPLLTKQLWLNVPPKPEENAPPPPPDALAPIVITLGVDGVTKVNSEVIARDELAGRVVRMVNARPDKVVFFDADSRVPYAQALEVMDLVRGGGVETLAVLADELPEH